MAALSSDTIVVTGIGMATAVGIDATTSGASFHAGISRARELSYFSSFVETENMDLPVVGSPAATQAEGTELFGKMLALGVSALRDLAWTVRLAPPKFSGHTALFIALPDYVLRKNIEDENAELDVDEREELLARQKDFQHQCDRRLGDRLLEISKFPLQIGSRRFAYGHACSFLEVLRDAMDSLTSRTMDCCIVGGIDSYLEPSTLEWGIEVGRIKLDGLSNGFSPGEGAGFIQIERSDTAHRRGARIQAILTHPTFSKEGGGTTSVKGLALAQAISRAIATDGHELESVYGNLNGEAGRAGEWGNAIIRLASNFPDLAMVHTRHPAEALGETGCATVPISIGFHVHDYWRGRANKDMLLWCIGEDDVRGALVVHAGKMDHRPDPDQSTVERQIRSAYNEQFLTELYHEHLEEASFLYEQRLFLLVDPELYWTDLHGFEERFEAHIDALVVGSEQALAVCREQALEGDSGELHAAVRVFCRQDRIDLFNEVVGLLDPEDDELMQTVADALCHEMPASWQQPFAERLVKGESSFLRVIAKALGYRRIPASGLLSTELEKGTQAVIQDFIWSLGRLRDSGTRSLLYGRYLQHDAAETREAAVLALLRIGEPAALQYCAGIARSQPWALVPIGLAGGSSQMRLLVDVAASEAVSPQCMLALGLMGEITAVDPLLYHLGDENLAEYAAAAMYLITGAALFEKVLIPEEIDEDELFEDELAEMQREGEQPALENEQRGTTISRISQQSDEWQQWWQQNKALFKAGVRHRLGRPYGPDRLFELLAAEHSPRILRQLAAEELVIRYGCDISFEVDAFVAAQLSSLAGVRQWVSVEGPKFAEGRYYFAGRPQTG